MEVSTGRDKRDPTWNTSRLHHEDVTGSSAS